MNPFEPEAPFGESDVGDEPAGDLSKDAQDFVKTFGVRGVIGIGGEGVLSSITDEAADDVVSSVDRVGGGGVVSETEAGGDFTEETELGGNDTIDAIGDDNTEAVIILALGEGEGGETGVGIAGSIEAGSAIGGSDDFRIVGVLGGGDGACGGGGNAVAFLSLTGLAKITAPWFCMSLARSFGRRTA